MNSLILPWFYFALLIWIFNFRWQARREYDRNMRAGLIPSRALQERRIVHDRNEKNGDGDGESFHTQLSKTMQNYRL